MITLVKAVVSALVILGINVVAGRAPTLGGYFASLPIITFLSVAWLLVDGKPNTDIAHFLTGVLLGLIPTALLIGTVAVSLRRGVPLALATLGGLLLWASATWLARRAGWLG